MDKAVQVCVKERKFVRRTNKLSQTETSCFNVRDVGLQCGEDAGSYNRGCKEKKWTYDRLKDEVLWNKDVVLRWCMKEKLIASERKCGHCKEAMALVGCDDRSDGYKWECRRQVDRKRHKMEMSIRKDSWFGQSNLTLEEVLKFTYWWCRDASQGIRHELGIGTHTGVDWDSFCRETCEVTLLEKEEKIGGVGKIVQIDESKFGKRKYHRGHRGHRVEGQWVFGGIEEESRRSFMVAVDKRDESTLLPIINRYIAKGTTIVSDCWKAYVNLEKHGYKHCSVNHSKEYVNSDGYHTNKIEGHWRQAKVKLPCFGVRKFMFSSHLAEFLWRYENKGNDLFDIFLDDVKKIYGDF